MSLKIVKFGTPTCGPCKLQETFLDNFVKEGFDVEIEKVDASEDMDKAEEFGVSTVPTLIVFDESGTEVKRFIGLTQTKQLSEFFSSYGKSE
jgi:thioredoxin 1